MPLSHLTVFFFVSFCCKFFFFLFQTNPLLFSLRTLWRLPDWSGEPSTKIPEKIDRQTAFWYDWTCVFLWIRCNLWARSTADERWPFDSDEPKFFFPVNLHLICHFGRINARLVEFSFFTALVSILSHANCAFPPHPKQFELYCQPNQHSKERLRPLWPSTWGRYVRAIHREKWIWFY